MSKNVERAAARVERALRSLNKVLQQERPTLPSIIGIVHLRNLDVFRVSFAYFSENLNFSVKGLRSLFRSLNKAIIKK